jgi:hypothetical protein
VREGKISYFFVLQCSCLLLGVKSCKKRKRAFMSVKVVIGDLVLGGLSELLAVMSDSVLLCLYN